MRSTCRRSGNFDEVDAPANLIALGSGLSGLGRLSPALFDQRETGGDGAIKKKSRFQCDGLFRASSDATTALDAVRFNESQARSVVHRHQGGFRTEGYTMHAQSAGVGIHPNSAEETAFRQSHTRVRQWLKLQVLNRGAVQ